MTTITQLPASFTFNAVAGNPATLSFNFTLTDATGGSISWSNVTGYQVDITDEFGAAIPGAVPTISNPAPYQLTVAWTASQTQLLNQSQRPRMALSIFIQNVGPYALVAGPINMTAPEYPAPTYSTVSS